jgi:hypothetical protein
MKGPPWIDPARAEFLIVVAVGELESEPWRRMFVRELPVVAKTGRYEIFEVDRFWKKIKSAYAHTTEFIDPHRDRHGRQYGGIGVLFQGGVGRSER